MGGFPHAVFGRTRWRVFYRFHTAGRPWDTMISMKRSHSFQASTRHPRWPRRSCSTISIHRIASALLRRALLRSARKSRLTSSPRVFFWARFSSCSTAAVKAVSRRGGGPKGCRCPLVFELWCPRQLFLPIPAASLREECYRKLSTGGTHGKRYARYSTAVERRSFGRNIDQLVCHDASPLLHPPLERTHAETYAGEPG